LLDIEDPHFLDNRLTDGSEVVKPYTPAAFYPSRKIPGISVRGRVYSKSIVLLEGLGIVKKKSNYLILK
jgi:hypothetical protein